MLSPNEMQQMRPHQHLPLFTQATSIWNRKHHPNDIGEWLQQIDWICALARPFTCEIHVTVAQGNNRAIASTTAMAQDPCTSRLPETLSLASIPLSSCSSCILLLVSLSVDSWTRWRLQAFLHGRSIDEMPRPSRTYSGLWSHQPKSEECGTRVKLLTRH
jgi:hypothetical protein